MGKNQIIGYCRVSTDKQDAERQVGEILTYCESHQLGSPVIVRETAHGNGDRSGIETNGKHMVILGRSNIVGKPLANIMLQKERGANAIVTICHTAAPDIAYFTRQADILVAAVGKPHIVTGDMVKDGVNLKIS